MSSIKHSTTRVLRRSAVSALAIALTFSALVAVAPAAPAVTDLSTWGSPGYTSLPVTYGSWSWTSDGTVWVPGRTVVESARFAHREQAVCTRPALYQVVGGTMVENKSWRLANYGWALRDCRIISASATTATTSGGAFVGLGYSGQYSVTVNVAWYVRNSTGSWVTVGTRLYDYNHPDDYRCATSGCSVQNIDGLGAMVRLG
ncbi:MAG TPA: hypothetical protein VFZ83_06470 [Acidimicrobiia bacterium]|nr:hypothetical protein [Acidimicrobiia bacterium]